MKLPAKYPASTEDFLRAVFGQTIKPVDRMHWYREYLKAHIQSSYPRASEQEVETMADERIGERIQTKGHAERLAENLLDWRKRIRSKKARDSALKK